MTSNTTLLKAAAFANLPIEIFQIVSQGGVYTSRDDLFDEEGHVKESSFFPITVAKANQVATNILSRYQLTHNQLHGSKIFHGTSSPVLIGLAKGEGILPYGELKERNLVPFSGANDSGLDSVGKSYLSTVWIRDFCVAIEYARARPWNPEKGNEKISNMSKHEFQKFCGEALQQELIGLEKKKIERWDSFTVLEQKLIETPFPMLIGIASKRKDAHVEIHGADAEIGLLHGASPEEIKVLFVPQEKVEFTRGLFQNHGPNVEPFSFNY